MLRLDMPWKVAASTVAQNAGVRGCASGIVQNRIVLHDDVGAGRGDTGKIKLAVRSHVDERVVVDLDALGPTTESSSMLTPNL